MPIVTKTSYHVFTAAFVLAAFTGGAATALEPTPVRFDEDPGAAERLEAADRLRTLGYEVASASCHLHNGIAVEQSERLLIESKESFTRTTVALRDGDPEMNILGAETDRRILEGLDALEATWTPVVDAAFTLLENPTNPDAMALIREGSPDLSRLTSDLMQTVSSEYTNPMDLLQADAILLDVVGRQAMLTQQIAVNACEIGAGASDQAQLDALDEAQEIFTLGMRALHDGMPELGIKPAPTPGIRFAIEGVMADWDDVEALLVQIRAGSADDAVKEEAFTRLNDKMYKLEELTSLYTDYSKHNYNTPSGG